MGVDALISADPATQASLLDAIQELSALHDLDAVTDVVTRAARAVVGADGAAFALREGDDVVYADEHAIAPLWKGRRFSLSECISGWAMLHRESIAVPDIYADPRVPVEAYRPTFVKSLAMIPIRIADPIGAIGVYWSRRHDATTNELALLQALANATAIAVANIELYGSLEHARKEAEHARALVEDLLAREQAARRAAEDASRVKDEFLAMLGHELRNPLAPITAALKLLRLRGGGAEREHEVIDRQVKHLSHLVDDLLDISRVTRGRLVLHRGPVSISEVVSAAVESASPLLEARRHHFDVDVAEDLTVEGDCARLVQVVANLLKNAAQYTPEAGHVRLSACAAGREVVIRVRDDGTGIDPALMPHIFDLFVQSAQDSDRSQGGLGLGLALVKSIVSLHGGSVDAASQGPGRGAELTVRLPALSAEHAPGAEGRPCDPALAPAPAVPSALRVLVVDDNDDAAQMLAEILGTVGWEVAVAGSGPDALSQLDRFAPDVALLDIGLPAMDGYELALRMRERLGSQAPRIFAVTGYGQDRDRERSRALGFEAHFVKPIDPDELLRAIRGGDAAAHA